MTKKTKKSQNKKFTFFIIAKKKIIILSVFVLLLLGTGTFFFLRYLNSAVQQRVNIAFCNIPEAQMEAIQNCVIKSESGKVTFKKVSLEDLSKDSAVKNYDLVFTYDGLAADRMKAKAANIPGKFYNYLPTSLRRQNEANDRKSIPILLDHFEFSYHRGIGNKINMDDPQTYSEFEEYLEKSKKYTFTPFFTNGGDDEILLGLISALIEARGGYQAYSDFISAVKKTPSVEKLMPLKLGDSGNFTFKDILDDFLKWQKNGIVHPNWFNAKYRDLLAFVEDGQVSVLFTKLSVHRTIPYKLIRDFSTERAPVLSAQVDHGLIAPALCAIKFSKKAINDRVIQSLLVEEGQSALSMGSQLGPVALRGESFDIQADDVRFFAASCRYGSRPDVLSAAFMPASESAKNFCTEIRRYLTLGRL